MARRRVRSVLADMRPTLSPSVTSRRRAICSLGASDRVDKAVTRSRYDPNPAPTSERLHTFRAALGDEAPGSTRGGSRMTEWRRWSRRSGARPIGAMVAAFASTRVPAESQHRTLSRTGSRRSLGRGTPRRKRAIVRGDVAVLAFEPGFDFIRSVFAALYAGMAIAPVPIPVGRDPRAAYDRLLAVVRDSGSRLVLTGSQGLAPPLDGGAGALRHRGAATAGTAEPDPARPTRGSRPPSTRTLSRSCSTRPDRPAGRRA